MQYQSPVVEIDARERLLEAQQQGFVAGEEIRRAQFRMQFRIDPARAHEAKRLGDVVCEFLVAFRLRRVLDEGEHPLMRVGQIGVAAGGEGAQQVERRRRLAIGLQLPARIGSASLRARIPCR